MGRDMKKLKESVHAIQVGCQICEGPHLYKDCPLNEEVKQVEEFRYGEFGRTSPFNGNNGGKFPVVIKSSVEDLIPIPSESKGIPDKMCDVPFRDNFPPLDISKDQFEGFSDSNDDSISIDDDSFSIDDIEYVEASPPDSELVNLEVVEIVIPEVGGIDVDILLTIKDGHRSRPD
ncbi:hypothetical protein Tco_0730244 [Tanacetum coccineum]|uniref:Uncharacterized protein n=1 Tax=Tanacetum coccineum TaxID=301880 RepID=A0ABQ4YUP5_9ASTR